MPDFFLRDSYDYQLPEELIAQYPLPDRTQSRLMTLDRKLRQIGHHKFEEIGAFLREGDLLAVNTSKVFPARLFGKKENGTPIEILLLSEFKPLNWSCLVYPGKRVKKPEMISFSDNLKGLVHAPDGSESRHIEFACVGHFWDEIHRIGHVPLPPYIKRQDVSADHVTYQTVYASENGSVAAPTAGFHFSEQLLESLKARGVTVASVVLHVGIGTFKPVKTENLLEHRMHSEYASIPEETALLINQAKQEGRRVVAVGTTTTRTLESFFSSGQVVPGAKWTSLFLYPGKQFNVVDALITNFHLPKSTLLMLVSAFAGYDFIFSAYREAIQNRYRFFSYGDAMFIH